MGFRLTAPDLPATPITGPPAPVSEVADELGLPAPAWRFDLGAVQAGVAGQVGEVTPVVVDGEASPTDGAIAISLGTNAPAVAVVTDGKTFTPARNPASPEQGEFIQNPYSGEIIVYTSTPIAGLVAYVRDSSLVPYRTRLPGPVPEWFSRTPLAGEFSVSLAFEQQPSGSLEFQLGSRAALLQFLAAFKPDTRIPLYGYGLRVVNVQFSQDHLAEQPQGYYTVQVSLSGASEWEMGQPVTVNELPSNTSVTLTQLAAAAGARLEMPETVVSLQGFSATDTLVPETELKARTRHQGLFVDFCDELVKCRNIDSVATWHYSDADLLDKPTVQYLGRHTAQQLSGTLNLAPVELPPGPLPTTLATVGQFTVLPEDPALLGRSNEFPGTEVTGQFSGEFPNELMTEDKQGQTASQAKPKWRQKTPEVITLAKGDENPTVPPDSTTVIKTMSLCYLNSGPTKVLEEATTENGSPVRTRTRIWGFVYLSRQVASESGDKIIVNVTNPAAYWRVCKDVTTTWVYDPDYGYELGTITTGWELFAFKTESDALETYEKMQEIRELSGGSDSATNALLNQPASTIDAGVSAEIAQLRRECRAYNIESKPVLEVTGRTLRLTSAKYKDIRASEGKWVDFTYTGPDGNQYPGRVPDPTWAPPYYTEEELTFQNSFDAIPNPEEPAENADGLVIELPPLTTGRESMVRRRVDVIPGPESRRTSISFSSSAVPASGGEGGGGGLTTRSATVRNNRSNQPDRYTEFLSEMSGEGASYKDMVVKTTFTEHVGRPGSADRKATDYEPEPPEDSNAPVTEAQDDNTLYIVTSPGYDPADEPRESTSYPYATTKAEAQSAVRTDAIVAEITNPSRSVSITVPINLQIRPGDRVQAMLSGIIYSCRVNQVAHQGQLLGLVEGSVEIEGKTQLTLSPDREPDFLWTERPAPVITGTGSQVTGSLSRDVLLYSNRLLGSTRTRRNF